MKTFDKTIDNIIIEMSVIRASPLYTSTSKGENIIAAAIKDKKTDFVYTGDSHYDAFFVMHEEEGYDFPVYDEQSFEQFRDKEEYRHRFIDGFYTNKDRFLNRNDALELMKKSKFSIKKDDLKYGKELHSNVVQDYQAAHA